MEDLADAVQERSTLEPWPTDVADLVTEAERILHERAVARGVHVLTTPCPAVLVHGHDGLELVTITASYYNLRVQYLSHARSGI